MNTLSIHCTFPNGPCNLFKSNQSTSVYNLTPVPEQENRWYRDVHRIISCDLIESTISKQLRHLSSVWNRIALQFRLLISPVTGALWG